MERVTNFAAGPSALPIEILEEAQSAILNFEGSGMGLMELSHRSKSFDNVIKTAESRLRELLNIPENYQVLFMQGGGSTQFSCVPLNLMGLSETGSADYIVTGGWSKKAAAEAKKYGNVDYVFPVPEKFTTIPEQATWKLNPNASYVYYCANETVHGVEFDFIPDTGSVPLVADMSSNILSREIDVSKFGLIYAGAQKNIGCTGVTIVIIRDDLIGKAAPICPIMLDYKTLADAKSLYNTPPTWSIYIANLYFDYVKQNGGLAEFVSRSKVKSGALYSAIEASEGFYTSPIDPKCRSQMNVPFLIRGGSKELEARMVKEATEAGMVQLAGHRSVGGLRASLYNALTIDDTNKLIKFMGDFKAKIIAEESA